MNVLTITGHLGRDAEVRYTANQTPVASFSVPMKSGFGDREQTDWVSCSFWGQRGESLAPHLLKGTLVAVSGELSTRKYQVDGQDRFSLDLNVKDVTLLSKKQEQAPQQQGFRDTPAQADDNGAPF